MRGMGGDAARRPRVRRRDRPSVGDHTNFDLYDDAVPVIEALRGHGLRLGLISNGQRDLEEFARHHALDVDVAVGSKAHGRTKPHASIFESALAALGTGPAETVMVGDSYADDIEGARALGMRAILLDRDGRYPGSRTASSTPRAPAALGLAVRASRPARPGAEPRDSDPANVGVPASSSVRAAVARDGHDPYSDRVLTDRSIARERPGRDRQAAGEEKRRLIIDAAVRVFARDGYHTSRVGDIAEEAGVAHGLLYHYFSSKEEVLATLFRENWGELLGRLARVEQSDEPADQQLRGIAKILLRTWRNDPDLVRVMVREVARSSHLQEQVDEIRMGFATIQRVIERGQAEGVFRADLDPRLAAWIFYGGLEEILTGWVLGQLPDGDEEVARAERTIIDVVCGGLTVRGDADA